MTVLMTLKTKRNHVVMQTSHTKLLAFKIYLLGPPHLDANPDPICCNIEVKRLSFAAILDLSSFRPPILVGAVVAGPPLACS